MSKIFATACCAAAIAFAPAAFAVDVENQDDTDYVIGVAVGDGSPTTFTIKAGEKKFNVCGGETCVLELDGQNWDGYTDEQVVIKGKKLTIRPRG